jgi:phospholipid-transporting ATPase
MVLIKCPIISRVGMYSAFSGQLVYENWLYTFYNVFYSSIPIIIYGLFDQEYADATLSDYPFLYKDGMQHKYFNSLRFFLWILNSFWQAVLLGNLAIYYIEGNFITSGGLVLDIWATGALILGTNVVIANFKILTFSFIHSLTGLFFIIASIGVYILSFYIVNVVSGDNLYTYFSE